MIVSPLCVLWIRLLLYPGDNSARGDFSQIVYNLASHRVCSCENLAEPAASFIPAIFILQLRRVHTHGFAASCYRILDCRIFPCSSSTLQHSTCGARTAEISACLSTIPGTAWSQCGPFTCSRCLLQQQLLCRSHQLPFDVISATAAALSHSAVWPRSDIPFALLRRRLPPPPPPHSGDEHPSVAPGGTRLAHCRSSRERLCPDCACRAYGCVHTNATLHPRLLTCTRTSFSKYSR